MRQFVYSLFILIVAGSAGYAQNLEGVYSPPALSTGHLRGNLRCSSVSSRRGLWDFGACPVCPTSWLGRRSGAGAAGRR